MQKLPVIINYSGPVATVGTRYRKNFSNDPGEEQNFTDAFGSQCKIAMGENPLLEGRLWVSVMVFYRDYKPKIKNMIEPILVALYGKVIAKNHTINKLSIESEKSNIPSVQVMVGKLGCR